MRVLILLFIGLVLFADTSKHLSSQMRAEVYAQNLIDGGYYKESKEFLNKAKEKYPKSETLWMFSATTEYELKYFDNAKIFFTKTLELNPKNEEAAEFKAIIEKQEEASENKTLSVLFEYLSDKGIDFISIFLAFLGGEIIARKYAKCNSLEIKNLAKQYKNRRVLQVSGKSRIGFAVKNYFSGHFSFCSLLRILIVMIIAGTFLIMWLIIELLTNANLFVDKQLLLMNSSEIWQYTMSTFVIFIGLSILLQIVMYMFYLKDSSSTVELELIEHLEALAQDNNLIKLNEVVKELKGLNISEDELMFEHLSNEAKEKITYVYNLMS